MSRSRNGGMLAVLLALTVAGFVLPFWPLCALCVVLMALSGRWLVAILAGLVLDLLWGVPLGTAHLLLVPFTLIAIVAGAARRFGGKYFIDRDLPERL